MKFILCHIIFLLTCFNSTGQKNNAHFISEVAISTNSTFSRSFGDWLEYKGRYGFGIGANHVFYFGHRINLVTGAEINQIRRWISVRNVRHFYSEKNSTLGKTNLTVPLGIRINFGRRHLYSFSAGVFYDQFLYGRVKGIGSSSVPDGNGIPVHKETPFNKSEELNNSFGFYASMGFKISISNSEFLIKPEFREIAIYNIYNEGDEDLVNYFRLNVCYSFKAKY